MRNDALFSGNPEAQLFSHQHTCKTPEMNSTVKQAAEPSAYLAMVSISMPENPKALSPSTQTTRLPGA